MILNHQIPHHFLLSLLVCEEGGDLREAAPVTKTTSFRGGPPGGTHNDSRRDTPAPQDSNCRSTSSRPHHAEVHNNHPGPAPAHGPLGYRVLGFPRAERRRLPAAAERALVYDSGVVVDHRSVALGHHAAVGNQPGVVWRSHGLRRLNRRGRGRSRRLFLLRLRRCPRFRFGGITLIAAVQNHEKTESKGAAAGERRFSDEFGEEWQQEK